VTIDDSGHGGTGRQDGCVVESVVAFLIDGTARDRSCPGQPDLDYLPLPQHSWTDYVDVLDAMTSTEFEVAMLPEIASWDGVSELAVGCPAGGRIKARRARDVDHYSLVRCAVIAGWPMTGEGVSPNGEGITELTVVVPSGTVAYTKSKEGRRRVEATLDGQSILIER
jgi:hypothetical protein